MNLFGIGYLLGRVSGSKGAAPVKKINDKVEYSCLWWGEKAEREDLSKEKIVFLLTRACHNGLVHKEHTEEGLCIFVPNSEEAKEKVLINISKIA